MWKPWLGVQTRSTFFPALTIALHAFGTPRLAIVYTFLKVTQKVFMMLRGAVIVDLSRLAHKIQPFDSGTLPPKNVCAYWKVIGISLVLFFGVWIVGTSSPVAE